MSVIESKIPSSVSVGEWVHIGKDCHIGEDVRICDHVNIYGCCISESVMIGAFTEIQRNVVVGENTRIQSHSFIASNTKIGNGVFLGHFTITINDDFKNYQVNFDSESWKELIIEDHVIIGSGCILFPVRIGRGAIIGAGSLVNQDVGENEIWYGRPARFIKMKS